MWHKATHLSGPPACCRAAMPYPRFSAQIKILEIESRGTQRVYSLHLGFSPWSFTTVRVRKEPTVGSWSITNELPFCVTRGNYYRKNTFKSITKKIPFVIFFKAQHQVISTLHLYMWCRQSIVWNEVLQPPYNGYWLKFHSHIFFFQVQGSDTY